MNNTSGFTNTSSYQPGGVAAGFHGRLCNRFSKTIKDSCGRWIAHQFVGKTHTLKIYTVYRVNPKSQRGDITAWQQQKRFLQAQKSNADPRKQIIDNLIKSLERDKENGTNIILFGDFNEKLLGRENTHNRLQNIGLVNLLQHGLHQDNLSRTHKTGSGAIDHMYISGDILNAVQYAGMAPFDFIGSTDHRGLYCDLFLDEILDTNQAFPHRRLKSSIPKLVKKYLKVVKSQWDHQNIDNRFKSVIDNLPEYDIATLEKKLNDIDQNITNLLRHAEKKCAQVPKIKNKAKYVSPDASLVEAITTYRNKQIEYDNAYREYRMLRGKDLELRIEHLKNLAEQHADEGGTIASELKKLQHIEEQRRSHTKIRYVVKPNSRDGVTSILIPAQEEYDNSEDQENYLQIDTMWKRIDPGVGRDIKKWECITDKNIVEPMLLEWQLRHFLQANGTPFANPEWKEKLDDEAFQESVLNGSYTPPDTLHPLAKEVLIHITRPAHVPEIEFRTIFSEFKDFIRKSNEKTSTSPSGRTYSHYKSLLKGDHHYLSTIHKILELALQNNIVLKRWRSTITTLIEKDKGQPCIHRMRAIHIIEAEVKFIAKLFYIKKLMHVAETNGLIADEQYGGHNRRQAQSAVINKMLYFNLSRQMRMTSAFIDIDARACYDRIVTSLSGLEGRKWGAPYKLSKFTTTFIESQEYKIRTGLGISDTAYEYSVDKPTQGSGQGIAWAGPRWINSSDTCSQVMKENCAGVHYYDPCGSNSVKLCGDYFIDDTATSVTANTLRDGNDIFQQAQHDEQVHAFTPNAVGHRIENAKNGYYLMYFVRDSIKPSCGLIHELEGDITIHEAFDSLPVRMKRLQPFQAHKTLGCFVAINGQSKRHFLVVKKQIQEWATKVRGSFLGKKEKIMAHEAYIKKTIEYIAPTAYMTKQQCATLDSLITPILFHIHNIQRNCSKSVLYTPELDGGFGYRSLWHIQGIEKLKFFYYIIVAKTPLANSFEPLSGGRS